jgi:hypothetical protein
MREFPTGVAYGEPTVAIAIKDAGPEPTTKNWLIQNFLKETRWQIFVTYACHKLRS